jgi:hypothetical protein
MVPTGVFLQELHEPSISKALAKATKVAESSQETPPPSESVNQSPKVMEIHSNWRTSYMIYFRIGACQRTWLSMNDCVIGQDSTL